MIEFVAQLLLLYGFSFLMSFYGIINYNKLKFQSKLINNLIGSIIVIGILSCIVLSISGANLSPILNGRLLIIGFFAYFIGPIEGAVAVLWSIVLAFLMKDTEILKQSIAQGTYLILFLVARFVLKKRNRNPRYYEIIELVLLANISVGVLSFFLAEDQSVFINEIDKLFVSALFEAVMFCALFNIFKREKERVDIIDNLGNYSEELIQQNKKIETLYQEVTSNQEEMKKNFGELSRYEERIEYLAFHETQTGFLNNDKLLERLRENKARKYELYHEMLFIGISGVDKLEKTLGIVLMDTLHYLVGIEIMAIFEELSNSEFFSIGKGKFSILIDNQDKKEEITSLYIQLQKRFLDSFIINTIELKVNIAAGGINLTEEVIDPEQWLEQCEFALYTAAEDQSTEGAIIWYGKELMERHSREQLIEKELYSALEKNELYLVYQAQYNNEKKLVSAEALLRWRNNELGDIVPMVFIPIAEKNGLIDSIGKIVVQKACQFVNRNREMLISNQKIIPISVNASFLELINPYFTERFLGILIEYNIPTECIRVEVTETEISLHYDELMENLKQLNNAGISVELDDFGTGYSSLNHLGIMPVHTIKIDKVFIDKIIIDNKIGDLVEMIIDFTHRFKMKVIAEGVETEDQFLWLKDKNCDIYQGYYFAKPMKEDLFLLQVKNNK